MKNKKLDVKIVSQEEALWTRVKDAREATIKGLEESMIIEKAFLMLAIQKIEESKFK